MRFLTRDDEAQASRAAEILTRECSEEEPGFLTSIVLAELVWTLSRVYQYSREDIAKALDVLLSAKELRFEYLFQNDSWECRPQPPPHPDKTPDKAA